MPDDLDVTPVKRVSDELSAPMIPVPPPSSGTPRQRTIRFRLACLVIACVLPVSLTAGFLVYYAYQQKRQLTEQRVLETARALSLVVDRQLAAMQASATALATSPSLVSGDFAVFYRQIQATLRDYPDGTAFTLADAAGQQVVNSFVPFGAPLPKYVDVWGDMRKVFETGKPVIINLYKGAVSGRPLVGIAIPVVRDGRTVYALVMTVPANQFAVVFAQQSVPSEWPATILDGNHVHVARNGPLERYVGLPTIPALDQRISKAAEGLVEISNRDGVPMVAVFKRSTISGWTVAIGIPKAVMLVDIRRWAWGVVGGTILLLIMGTAVAQFLGGRIAGSIQALIAPALALGTGEPVEVRQLGIAEVNEVGQSLVKASELLQQRTAERKQAEIESRAREQRLRLAADAAQLGIFEWTVPTDSVVWENQRMYEIFGIPETTDPVNRDRFVRETLHPEDLPRFNQELEESMQPGALFRGAYRIRPGNDGQWRWIQYFSKFELTPDGKPLRLLGVLEDITERKRAEERLRESERQFRELAEGIPQLAWMANADGWIFWYNQRWYQYTGTTPQQMEGWGWQSVHDPNELPKVMEQWKVSIATGEPFDMVFPLRGVDGVFRPFLTRVMPLRDSQGKVVRWFGTNTDISEQRRTEEALRESEERWATTLHSIGDAVISTCAQGKVIFMNAVAEKLTGWPLAKAQGRHLDNVFDIVNEVTRIKPESPVAKVIRLGQVVGLANHTALISRNGTEFPIEDSGAPIRDDEGRITGVVLVFHDINEKRKAEKALRDSERLATTGRLASTLAHEIHNPLEAVVNLLFLIDHDPSVSEKVRQYTTMAGEELARVTQMTRHMLAFQREAAKPVPIKIGEILDNVIALYEKKIESAGVQVQRQVEFEREFLGLPGEMRQVFANLVGNAIEAIGKNGKLRLHAYPSRDWHQGRRGLRVVVADNGPGIPAAVRDKIFEPFFTTKGESGTGLGLWITSGIVEKNDGKLRLRTVTRGGRSGTCFSVFFPFPS